MTTRGHNEPRNNKHIDTSIMKKQFVKMAALAVMVMGVLGAQASAASLSLNVNLANGQVHVGLGDNDCHHAHQKKVVKHVVKHVDKKHVDKKHHVASKHDKKHNDKHKFVARHEERRNHRR